uniref:NADH-ubiquinone oxidoreductase chain 2 n=1 Tax=Phyllocoptes taishanensis TaxID=1638174 RepID=A0A0U2IWN2_9ACAR|nr:NADH dehydrogenase subunit 2 [Phyllocoptes taishanensis]ALK03808.1 NADH dehydrogenase subunit 2 [Phyllocoptes taishanensis]
MSNLFTEKIMFVMSYMLMLSLFMGANSFIVFWIFMEVNMMLFLCVINFAGLSSNLSSDKESGLYYFLMQSLGSIGFLTSFLFLSYDDVSTQIFSVLSLMLKLGLPPFHFWMFKLSVHINKFSLAVLLTLQKAPLVVFLFFFYSGMMTGLSSVFLVLGSLMMIGSRSLIFLLVSSSIYLTGWLLVIFSKFFWGFMIFYFLYFLMVVLLFQGSESCYWMYNLNSKLFISFLFFLGLPPMPMFFFKFYAFDAIMANFTLGLLVALVFSSFVALMGYFKFFFSSFTNKNFLYHSVSKPSSMYVFMSLSVMSAIVFLS